MPPKYSQDEAAEDTESPDEETTQAWHDARDDAAKEGGWGVPADRHDSDDEDDKDDKDDNDKDDDDKDDD